MTGSVLLRGLSPRALASLAILLVLLLVLPLVADSYIVSVMLLVLFAAYLGQAWNIMMGYVGLLSIGHALYVGLGAYASAALFVHYGVSPWIGMLAGIVLASLAGTLIGALSFRFGVTGVYFALLTIAFAEFTRILFDHFAWVNGSSGLFLPVKSLAADDLLHLRGSPAMFYYVMLALVLAALALSRALIRGRIGFYWQAIREDQDAAEALGIDSFKWKLAAVALSAAMAAIAGVIQAFYYNNLYPGTVFAVGSSVELMSGPIVGGLGTLIGPLLGAFLLTGLGEAMTALTGSLHIDGIKQFAYGAVLLVIVVLQPGGIWPWLARRLGFDREGGAA
ncbi:MAG TPA: branched-chain amino acid ABC transporter permease [Stellaceae bacterium]|nr:branched-chain amino acid ABC transporter permease [Stellaceae bacterium]